MLIVFDLGPDLLSFSSFFGDFVVLTLVIEVLPAFISRVEPLKILERESNGYKC